MFDLVTEHLMNYFYVPIVCFSFCLEFQVYTKKKYMKLFLVSVQQKELSICSKSVGYVLTAELHCFTLETELMLARFAMEI